MTGNGSSDARGYVNARDGRSTYAAWLREDRARRADLERLAAMRRIFGVTDLGRFFEESRGIDSDAPWSMRDA